MFQLLSRRCLHYKTYPSIFALDTKQTFQQSAKNNKLFHNFKQKLENGKILVTSDESKIDSDINSSDTLPRTYSVISLEKEKINNSNSIVPNWRKSPTLWFRIIKSQMKIYREAIKNSYKVHKKYRNQSSILYSNQQLLKDLEFNLLDEHITRTNFVEMYRKNEFWKLPRFLIMFFIFEELFLVMVYLWPKLGLRSALSVGAYKKITESHVLQENLQNKLCGTVGIGKNISSISSPYDLDIKTLKQLLNQLPTNEIPGWKISIWKTFNVKSKLANLVADKHEYYVVDDWLLLRKIMNSESGITTFSKPELVNLIAERQLYKKNEDLNAMVNDDVGQKILLWRLALYWSFRFDNVNILSPKQNSNFTNKWGVNNVSILNFPGTLAEFGDKVDIFDKSHLTYLVDGK